MKVLIIHHLEPIWENGYGNFGTSFEKLQEKFVNYLNENEFDKVILTRLEDSIAIVAHGYWQELIEKINCVYEYAYGWTWEMFEDSNYDKDMLCEGGNHSECVLLEPWMFELKARGAQVTLTGAFEGECIEDMEIALSHLQIPFTKERSLIV